MQEERKKNKSFGRAVWNAILSEGNLFYYIAVLFYFVGVIDTIMMMQECAAYKDNIVYKWLQMEGSIVCANFFGVFLFLLVKCFVNR